MLKGAHIVNTQFTVFSQTHVTRAQVKKQNIINTPQRSSLLFDPCLQPLSNCTIF